MKFISQMVRFSVMMSLICFAVLNVGAVTRS